MGHKRTRYILVIIDHLTLGQGWDIGVWLLLGGNTAIFRMVGCVTGRLHCFPLSKSLVVYREILRYTTVL